MSDWLAGNMGFKVRRAFYLNWIHVKWFSSQLPKFCVRGNETAAKFVKLHPIPCSMICSQHFVFSISRVLRCVFTCDPIIHLFTRSNFCPIFAPIPLCSHPLPNICDILFSMAPCFSFVCSPPFLSTLCSLVYPLPNVDNISGATMDKSGQMLLICQRLSRKREKTLREKLIKILTWQLCNLPSEGAIEKICVMGLL